jgi:hypothetical protein
MSRWLAIVCAGALLSAAAGCSLGSFTVALAPPGGPKQVVPGTVAEISARLQAGLSDAGIAVIAKRQEQEVRLVCRAKQGRMHCLILKPDKAKGGEKTVVTVNWDREADERFWQMIVGMLTAPAADETALPTGQAVSVSQDRPTEKGR